MVNLEYDKHADAVYIYLEHKGKRSKDTVVLNNNIILDFDKEQKLIGIEVLSASRVLSRKALSEAKAV